MRLLLVLTAIVSGLWLYQRQNRKAAPPPPPPPAAEAPTPLLKPEDMARVKEATRDPDQNVRWEAAQFLVRLNHAEADAILFGMLGRDDQAELRARVAGLIANRRGPQASQALVGALKDIEPSVRAAALRALAKVGDYGTATAVSEALRDPDEAVRLEAVRCLNAMQDRKNEEARQNQLRQEELRRKAEEESRRR